MEKVGVLKANWPQVQQSERFNTRQLRTLDAIKRCRTASLGGSVDGCSACGHLHISYNSTRNRHCPKCQGVLREQWIQTRHTFASRLITVLPVITYRYSFTAY